MPAKRAMTEKEFFKNANTWKQISTNVPPKMLEALKSRVTKEFTMSHLLRELIAESSLMRYGQLPRPRWCAELIDEVASLKEEISAEKEVRADAEKALTELRNEIAELKKVIILQSEPTTVRQQRRLERARFAAAFDATPPDSLCAKQIRTYAPDCDPFVDDEPQEVVVAVEQSVQPKEESPNPILTKARPSMSIFSRLTEMLGVTRKTA